MRLSDVIAFLTGDDLAQGLDLEVRPGDRFCRFEGRHRDWIYVVVTALNDGSLPEGCIYATAFCREIPSGRSGYCRLDELHVRLDLDAWEIIRCHGWSAPGVALGLEEPGCTAEVSDPADATALASGH